MPAANNATLEIHTMQQYDRLMMGELWKLRAKFDRGQVSILDALYKNRRKGDMIPETSIRYMLSNTIPGRLGYGRLYGSKGALETLQSDIRGTLCRGLYTDIDMVNAHPVLIPQLAKRLYDMEMPFTIAFNENRDSVLAEIMQRDHCSRDTAKAHIFNILYDGKMADDAPIIFRRMYEEVRLFTKRLMLEEEHSELLAYIQKQDKRIYGAFLSYIMQTEERRVLLCMKASLEEQGLQCDVLAYDGIMTRGVNNVSDEILRQTEADILNETSYAITLKIKPLEIIRDLDAASDEMDAAADDAYTEMRTRWEESHFHYKPTNTVVEVVHGKMNHYTQEHALSVFNMWRLPSKTEKPELFIRRWLEDPERRMIDTLLYKPQAECKANEFSLFSGYTYQNIEAADDPAAVAAFNTVLRAVSNNSAEVYDYILKTFAHMVQRPCDKTGICIILCSPEQGTGKDTLLGWMMKLMGNHVAHYTSGDIFWDKHDTRKEGAVMMYLEEAGAENRTRENALKARITSDDVEINPKGLRGYTVPSIARYFMTTNEINPVKLDETDRRFMIVNCSPELRTQREFWTQLHQQLATNPAWLTSVGKMLEGVDISGWNPRVIPTTAYKEALQECSVKSEKMFLQQWGGERVSAGDLYLEYREYCQSRSIPYCSTAKSFGMALVPYIGTMVAKVKAHGVMRYSRVGEVIPEVHDEPVLA
jgi:hypothetical protein